VSEYVQTVIVGGGQAGLATSYWLTQAGRDHLIFEQAPHPAEAWRTGRWDSFALVTPNWMTALPGAEYAGGDPDGFMPRDEVVAYFDRYVESFKPPLRCSTRVTSLERDRTRYLIRTDSGAVSADNVVIATGFFQRPKVPADSVGFHEEIQQLHSSAYRSPDELQPGAVLVVGSGQSGGQIAEELHEHGRKVYLCVGGAPHAPRHYRDQDTFRWLDQMGFFDQTVDQLPPAVPRFVTTPLLTGKNGGYSLNLHRLARDGLVLLGHMKGVRDGKVYLAPDLKENLARADAFEKEVLKRIDDHIAQLGIPAPDEELVEPRDGFRAPEITELGLEAAGISNVIWATGYTFSFNLVKLPVFDRQGFPIQEGGVTTYPGLYFVGLPWLPKRGSAFLYGVGENAERIATQIADRSSAAT
jgi:putative flavoprotein involved in K+ transport